MWQNINNHNWEKMSILNKKNLSSNIPILLILPFLFNFMKNLFDSEIVLINYYISNQAIFLLLIINSAFYFYLTKEISGILNLESLSLSLFYFLSSYFFWDFLFVALFKEIKFQYSVAVVSIFWLLFLWFKSKSVKKIIYLVTAYSGLALANNFLYTDASKLGNYIELNTDVPIQWFQIAERIHSNNFYYGFTNNLIDGHGLFLSYTQSLIYKINFFTRDFEFVRLNSNLFIIFTIFLICDLNISNRNKLITSSLFVLILLNSDWLTYLFLDSLMLEGAVSLFFATFIINLNKHLDSNINLRSLIFFSLFSCLLFSKEFISTLTIVVLIYLLLIKKNNNVLIAIPIYFINETYQTLFTPDAKDLPYLEGFKLKDFLLDVVLLRDLEVNNIIKIINQFVIDKPMSLLFVIFLILNMYSLQKNHKNFISSMSFWLIVLNVFMVIILYIYWWKDYGIQSSYRYILNVLHLVFISIGYNIELFQKKK